MFDHVTIGAADRDAAQRFYRTVLPALGYRPRAEGPEWGDFSIHQAGAERPVTTRLHIGFAAASRARVDAFWRAGVGAGYRDDGAPGPHPQYGHDLYGAFLLDPDGNSAEAVVHGGLRVDGCVDHLWIRVADRPASKRFYATIAPHAGFRQVDDESDRTRYSRGPAQGSFTIVDGDRPTTPFHLAFAAPDDAAVNAFHRAGTQAGFVDNGAPGERVEYHRGYFAAFVLDPDGHNIEAVHHLGRAPLRAL
jgi:catechol 2,3-dioxygenase-like lactoylglutathione lyase family enzyme